MEGTRLLPADRPATEFKEASLIVVCSVPGSPRPLNRRCLDAIERLTYQVALMRMLDLEQSRVTSAPWRRRSIRRRLFSGSVLGIVSLLSIACLNPNEPGRLVPKTVEQDPSLPAIEVAGTRLHSETFGDPDAPMVMVLHGGPGADYRSLLDLQALADDGYFVVFWDQRGAGLSQRHDADIYDLDLPISDLQDVIEYYTSPQQDQLVFIGHSWGAMLATYFINERGDLGGRIAGAVLSEPGAFNKRQLDDYFTRLIGSLNFVGEDVGDAAWIPQFLSATDHESADYLAQVSIGSTPAEGTDEGYPEWRSGAVCRDAHLALVEDGFDWTTHLDAYENEVLFLRSSENESMPLWHQEELASAYPNAHIVTMEGVGHEMVYQDPREYLRHVRQYFSEIGFAGEL